MISEEKFINRLRKRRTKIFALIFITVATLVPIIYGYIILNRLTEMIPKSGVPEHFLLLIAIRLNVQIFFSCAMLGLLIAHLIVELGGWSKDRLLISMWDKIKRQEEEINRIGKMLGKSSNTDKSCDESGS